MSTYYVDPVNGSDSNNGLGPDASHATNKPFATIAKLIAASGAMVSADQAYLAPGSYREVVTAGITSPTSETKITGDPNNSRGFKTSGGVLVAPGDVRWTANTTNDTSAPSATTLLTFNDRDYLTFENINLIGGTGSPSVFSAGSGTVSTNIKFMDCTLITGSNAVRIGRIETAANTPGNWTFDRCVFVAGLDSTFGGIHVVLNRHSADYDANIVFQNCRFYQPSASTLGIVRVVSAGSGSGFGGGVDLLNCTAMGGTLLAAGDASLSTSIPCTVNNSIIFTAGTGLSANTSGQITENYNYIWAATARSNVSAGANSISGNPPAKAPLLNFDGYRHGGRYTLRPFLTPLAGSPLLNFGGSSAPSVDASNRPRPAGSGLAASAGTSVAVGALERHDTAVQETSTVDASGSGFVIVGPGDHDILVPVTASSTTISVKVRYDTTHDATNKPQAILLANDVIGVSSETKTMTSAADTWETLTFSAFTPSAKGVVTIRLVSRAAAGGGKAFFDTFTVSP